MKFLFLLFVVYLLLGGGIWLLFRHQHNPKRTPDKW